MPIPTYLGILLVAYIIGGIPFGLLIGKLNGIDVRSQGSGNIGATNVTRICGKKWGIPCFLLDFLKGFLPTLTAVWLANRLNLDPSHAGLVAAVGAVCGHVFCPYLKFRGGKGIATSAGAIMAIAAMPLFIAFGIWILVLLFWRYVGLASVCAAVALPSSAFLLRHHTFLGQKMDTPILITLAALGCLAVWRHRGNLKRVLNGTESKIGRRADNATETSDHHENHRSQ